MTTTRSNRIISGVLVGAGATALTGTMLFTGVSSAHEATPTTTDGTVAPATTPTTMADAAQRTLMAGDAGSVTVERSGDVLKVVATAPMSGWTATVKRATGHTVKVAFTSETTKVLVRAHLTGEGQFRYSVSERRDPEAMKAAFIKGVAAKAEAERVAADQAAADKAAADKAAAEKVAPATDEKSADATADDHDGNCDHDGFRGSDVDKDDDGHGEFRQASDGGSFDGFRDGRHGGHGRR